MWAVLGEHTLAKVQGSSTLLPPEHGPQVLSYYLRVQRGEPGPEGDVGREILVG